MKLKAAFRKYNIFPICTIKFRRFVYLPHWFVSLWSITHGLLWALLLTALIVLFLSSRRGHYLEHCINRLCDDRGNLQCVKGICQCQDNQYYFGSCISKKNYLESCQNVGSCTSNLNCANGFCKCADSQYWSYVSNKCKRAKSFKETCTEFNECNSKSLLSCDKTYGTCICDSTRYWNNITCLTKKIGDEKCQYSEQCDNNLALACNCKTGQCDCSDQLKYWNTTVRSCVPKTGFQSSCVESRSCLGEFVCKDKACTCPDNYAYSSKTNKCEKCRKDSLFSYDKRCYKEFPADTWTNAIKTCEDDQMWLLTPIDDRELLFVVKRYFNKLLWIGYSRNSCPGNDPWIQIANSLSPYYTKFCPGEPNCQGGENCLQIKYNDCYNDMYCNSIQTVLCQYEP